MREQENFADRLTHLIHEHRTSHAKIGRVVGVSGQAVGKWAKGGNIEYDNLQTLAKHFNVNWIWLRYGDDAMVSFSERRTGSGVRRAVIKEIVDNEQRMRLALGAVKIGTWDLGLIDGQMVLSDVAQRLLGMDANNLQENPLQGNSFHGNKNDLMDCVAEIDRERVDEALTQVLDNHQSSFNIAHAIANGKNRVRHRGKVVLDDAGRPARIVCVITLEE